MGKVPLFWKLAAGWALLIFVLSSIPGRSIPAPPFAVSDKLLHAGVYSVLGFFCFFALPRPPSRRAAVHVALTVLAVTLYGCTDEFHQLFVPGRSPDPLDVMADCVGGAMGAIVGSLLPFAKSRAAS